MTCPDCTQARAGMWHGYSYSCPNCCARAVARGLPAFNALHPQGTGERDQLRDTVRRAMPTTDPAEARRMVWEWWRHDHPEERKGATC